ncbi:MAG: hypothetical protein JWN48_1686 [Myxococcaceae bacterium]|nr:hypothetical protein [Myxococcaceae bacterium]
MQRHAAPGIAVLLLSAGSVGCLEAPAPDLTYPHTDVSGEVFRVFCRRVAKSDYPTEADGQRFYAVCDGQDADGEPRDPEAEPMAGLRALLRRRPEIMDGLARVFGETAVAGGATFDEGELSGFLNALVPLYDKPNETIPTSTRGIAQLLGQLTDPDDARASKVMDTLVRLVQRKGYRTPEQNLGAIRALLQYPELDVLARKLLPVVSAGGAANKQWIAVLNATALELADEPVVASDLDQTTLHTALDLLLKDDSTQSSGNVQPAVILQREKGSGNAIGAVGEGLPTPFKVAGVDDGAERDRNGLASSAGQPLYQSFDATPTLLAALMRETSVLIGRGDAARSPLENFAHGFRPMLGPWGERTEAIGQNPYAFEGGDVARSPFLDLLHVFTSVARYPETETLIKVLEQLIREHENDAMHFVAMAMSIADRTRDAYPEAKLTGPHELWDDMIDVAMRMNTRPGLFDAVIRSFTDPRAAAQGRLFASWMRHKDVVTYPNAPIMPSGPNGAFSAQEADGMNQPVRAPLSEPVDRSQADVGMNRSVWQRTMSLIHGLNGVKVCNKANGVLRVPTTLLGVFTFPGASAVDPSVGYMPCELFEINDAVELYFLSLLGKAPFNVKDNIALGLAAVGLPLGQVPPVPDIIEQNTQIKGLRDLISPQAMARLVFAPNNKFLSDLYSPVLTVDGVAIKDYEPFSLFPMENPEASADDLSFVELGVPLTRAFDSVELRDATGKLLDGYMLGNLLDVFHKHWSSRKSEACPAAPESGNEGCTQSQDPSAPFYSPQTNLVSYEALIADMLDAEDVTGVLHQATLALASIHVTAPDGADVDGIAALASFVQRLATPDPALKKRDGSSTSKTKLCVLSGDACQGGIGHVIPQLSPLHMLSDALEAIDATFGEADNQPRLAAWHAGRSGILDKILAVDRHGSGDSASYSLHDRTGYNIALSVLPWVVERFEQHRAAGDLESWTQGLTERVATLLRHPLTSSLVDLLDAFWPEVEASGEFTKVSAYLTDEQNELAYRTMLTAIADSMTLLDRDENLSPAIQFAALALAPNAFLAIDGQAAPNADKSVAYAGLELTGGVVSELNKKLTPGKQTALTKLLGNLVLGDEAQRSPLEVLIDAAADVNRPDATALPDTPLSADENRDVFGDVQSFLYDQDQEKRSLERLYSVIQARKVH